MDFMSRPGPLYRDMGLQWQWAAVSRQESYVATGFLVRQGGLGRDRDFSVATGMGLELSGLVAIESTLSRQRRVCLMSRQRTSQHDRLQGGGRQNVARAQQGTTESSVSALCTQPNCYSALCCALFRSLYMDTVHEHYSWALFKR